MTGICAPKSGCMGCSAADRAHDAQPLDGIYNSDVSQWRDIQEFVHVCRNVCVEPIVAEWLCNKPDSIPQNVLAFKVELAPGRRLWPLPFHMRLSLTPSGKFQPTHIQTTRFFVLSMFCSIVPDLDVVGYFAGIEYESLFGHRGITHSFLFAFVLALVTVRYGFPGFTTSSAIWWGLCLHFFLVTASHGVLDAMTNGGRGVAFFAPFDETRYFFPWRPVQSFADRNFVFYRIKRA